MKRFAAFVLSMAMAVSSLLFMVLAASAYPVPEEVTLPLQQEYRTGMTG